jgi:hypothetical protein
MNSKSALFNNSAVGNEKIQVKTMSTLILQKVCVEKKKQKPNEKVRLN